jgi:mRNA interferase RelE/StbE
MAPYDVRFARSARKELERLGEPILTRIFLRFERLGLDPRPTGCRKLEGGEDLWRIRVGDYRIIYSLAVAYAVHALRVHNASGLKGSSV